MRVEASAAYGTVPRAALSDYAVGNFEIMLASDAVLTQSTASSFRSDVIYNSVSSDYRQIVISSSAGEFFCSLCLCDRLLHTDKA
jgi:hypothetical protein